jgi:hypothetical protein
MKTSVAEYLFRKAVLRTAIAEERTKYSGWEECRYCGARPPEGFGSLELEQHQPDCVYLLAISREAPEASQVRARWKAAAYDVREARAREVEARAERADKKAQQAAALREGKLPPPWGEE